MDAIVILIIVAVINALVRSSRKKSQEREKAAKAARQAQAAESAAPVRQERTAVTPYGRATGPRQQTVDPRFPAYESAEVYAQEASPEGAHLEAQQEAARQEAAREAARREAAHREVQKQVHAQKAEALRRQRVAMQRGETQGMEGDSSEGRSSMMPRTGKELQSSLYEQAASHLQATQGRNAAIEGGDHAHMEGSMEGSMEMCPPELRSMVQQSRPPKPRTGKYSGNTYAAALHRLAQSRGALAQGVLMAEILGKPKALRAK